MHVFDTPGSVSLQIELPSGRVVVATADEPRTTVEVVPVGRRGSDAVDDVLVTCDERGGRHVVRVERRDGIRWGPIQISWGADVEVRIACPAGASLELSGGSTDLRVDGELGEVSARTASGDVRLGTVRERLEVKTASGDVSVGRVAAEASIVTVSGDLELERLEGEVTARTVSGDATVGSLSAPLTLSTTSGDAVVRRLDGGGLRVQTVSGDVRIGVGRGTPVWIDAASVSGKLESELDLEESEPTADPGRAVVPVHVKTVSGDVAIVRAAEALAS